VITRAPPRRGYPTRLHPWHCQLAAPTARCLARPTQRARCQVLVDCLATQTELPRVPGVGVRLPAARAQARGRATLRLLRVTRSGSHALLNRAGEATPHKKINEIEDRSNAPFLLGPSRKKRGKTRSHATTGAPSTRAVRYCSSVSSSSTAGLVHRLLAVHARCLHCTGLINAQPLQLQRG
jgi:hypothetical protein